MIGQIVSMLLLGWLIAAAPVQAVGPEKTVPTASSAPSAEAKVAKALEEIKREGAIQTRFTPQPKLKKNPPPSGALADFFKWVFGSGAWIWSALGWGLIALLVLGILYLTVPVVRDFVDGAVGRFRQSKHKGDGQDEWQWQPDQQTSRNLLNEAEALARDGRFDEAVHLLLGRSVEDIARRQPTLLKPAYTARTISTMPALPPAARSAFGTIATIVERGIWAQRPVDAQDWGTARDAYSAFAFGDSWKAAA